MGAVHGVADLAVFTSLGRPTLRIDIDRKAAARYGMAPGDINSAIQTAIESGSERDAAILQACQTRFRPVMMTCIAACVGLFPAALSTAIGAQVQRPLALVVVGGLLLTPILVLIILPVLIDVFSRRTRMDWANQRATEPAE